VYGAFLLIGFAAQSLAIGDAAGHVDNGTGATVSARFSRPAAWLAAR
jgi:hypothetical protein